MDNIAHGLNHGLYYPSLQTYINTRGIEIRGSVDEKIGFYTLLTDNQAVFPHYVNDKIAATMAVPGEGFWKSYRAYGLNHMLYSSSRIPRREQPSWQRFYHLHNEERRPGYP